MIPGSNQNVRLNGRDYHVQTEDSGLPGRLVTTHIYIGGTIIASKKTSYAALTTREDLGEARPVIQRIMDEQHQLMVRNLRSGMYTDGLQHMPPPTSVFVLGDDPRGVANSAEIDDCATDLVADSLEIGE